MVKAFTPTFPYGVGTTERVIEIPWVLSRYNDGLRVLEVGCSFAYENREYIEGLTALNIPELHGIDISSVEAPDFIKRTGDIRASGYETDFFDLILCVSTIEHVGRDNTKYYKPIAELPWSESSATPPDVAAMAEMIRIVNPHGEILLTVPFGRFVDYGWFINYDSAAIARCCLMSRLRWSNRITFNIRLKVGCSVLPTISLTLPTEIMGRPLLQASPVLKLRKQIHGRKLSCNIHCSDQEEQDWPAHRQMAVY